MDGMVFEKDIIAAFNGGKTSILLLIPILLGVDTLNPVYYSLIKVWTHLISALLYH